MASEPNREIGHTGIMDFEAARAAAIRQAEKTQAPWLVYTTHTGVAPMHGVEALRIFSELYPAYQMPTIDFVVWPRHWRYQPRQNSRRQRWSTFTHFTVR